MLLIILIVLACLFLFGGLGYQGGAYRGPGISLGAVIIVILVILLLTGRI